MQHTHTHNTFYTIELLNWMCKWKEKMKMINTTLQWRLTRTEWLPGLSHTTDWWVASQPASESHGLLRTKYGERKILTIWLLSKSQYVNNFYAQGEQVRNGKKLSFKGRKGKKTSIVWNILSQPNTTHRLEVKDSTRHSRATHYWTRLEGLLTRSGLVKCNPDSAPSSAQEGGKRETCKVRRKRAELMVMWKNLTDES